MINRMKTFVFMELMVKGKDHNERKFTKMKTMGGRLHFDA